MDNSFYRTKFVLKTLSSVLSKFGNDRELKKYFTEYILIVFYSEFEDKFKNFLKEVLMENSNENLSEFISKSFGSIFKMIGKTDLKNSMGYFGKEKKEKFKSLTNSEDNILQKYENFVINRHRAAHQGDITISWEEVENIDKIGERLIEAISKSLKI